MGDIETIELLNVFIHAPLDFRARRVMEALGLSQSKARDRVNKTDKQRRTYYDYYASRDWGVMSNYDMCLNAKTLGIQGAADIIINCVRDKVEKSKDEIAKKDKK